MGRVWWRPLDFSLVLGRSHRLRLMSRELLLVVLALNGRHLRPDLVDALLDGLLALLALLGRDDDRRRLLFDAHLAGLAQLVRVEQGALTAQTFKMPRSLLMTTAARASLSTSSAMISSGRCLASCATFSSRGSRSRTLVMEYGEV